MKTNERDKLLGAIADSYRRMATNKSWSYRKVQMEKCDAWLARLTELNEEDPASFSMATPVIDSPNTH